jgi:hypothetical protein
MRSICTTACAALLAACLLRPVKAEDNSELYEANVAALQEYRHADPQAACQRLRSAVRSAVRRGIRGPALARTYANLGVVLAEGTHDHRRAVRAFRRALREDPQLAFARETASEAVRLAFAEAEQSSARSATPELASAAR